ncbi:MAG: hypothetical protein AAFX65_13735 [Cyanobacteria bacterium J06638_7]
MLTSPITSPFACARMKYVLVLLVVASVAAGIAIDRTGRQYRRHLWQLQGAAMGVVVGYIIGRTKSI